MTIPQRRPNRALGGIHDEFWRYCNGRELRLQQCARCDTFAWPPVPRCEECAATELPWRPVAGTGELVSWATFEHRYFEELPLPWETILVALDEGPLFVSNPLGFTPQEMQFGLTVQVDYLECEDDSGPFLLPVFRRLVT